MGFLPEIFKKPPDGQTDAGGVQFDCPNPDYPFVSEAQRAWMWANHPAMAELWEAHTKKGKKLPKRKRKQIENLLANYNPD